jgi:transposase-like protein
MAQDAPITTSLDCHRSRLSPEGQARVIHLLFTEGLSVEIVAERFGVGSTTIRRIRSAYCEKIDARQNKGARR